jgi:hypothetical protein
MKIKLTKGFEAIASSEDADLAELRWYTTGSATAKWRYAQRDEWHKAEKRYYTKLMHRVIAERMGILAPGLVVDHMNGDCMDNRRENLRAVTVQGNARNQGGATARNKTGILGVRRCEKTSRWHAYITVSGRMIQARFDDMGEAKAQRLAWEREYFGVQPRREAAHAVAG